MCVCECFCVRISRNSRQSRSLWDKNLLMPREAKRCIVYDVQYVCNSVCALCVQAKQKKIRDKYGDQDEEERQLRMKILAVRHSHTLTPSHTSHTSHPSLV